jgi:hypothetical protein
MADVHTLKNTDYNDFSLRTREYTRTKSLTYIFYFPYIAINKTNIDLTLKGLHMSRELPAMSTTFIKPVTPKMHLEVANYEKSQEFDITTFGVSGTVVLQQKK